MPGERLCRSLGTNFAGELLNDLKFLSFLGLLNGNLGGLRI